MARPVEMLVVKFPGNQFTGEITPAIADLVDNGIIRVIDILFIAKDADGNVDVVELADLGDEEYVAFESVVAEVDGMLNESDAQQFASLLEPNSSAGLMLFENNWASRFVEAVRNSKGEVLFSERMPLAVIEELEAEAAQT